MRARTRSCTSWGLMWQVLSSVRLSVCPHHLSIHLCTYGDSSLSSSFSNRAPLAGGLHSSHLLPMGHKPPFDGDSFP